MNSSERNIKNLALGAGFGLIGKFLGRFLSICGDIAAARILGPTIFGLYSIGWTLFRLIEIVAPLGLDRGVLRFIPRFIKNDHASLKGTIFQSIGISFIFSCLLGAVFYFSSPWLANSVFKKPELVYIFRFFAYGFPLAALLPVIAAITRSSNTVKYSVLVQDIGQPVIALVLLGIFYINGARLLGILSADILSYAFAVIWGSLYILRIYPGIFKPELRSSRVYTELLRYSIPIAIGSAFSVLIYWVDRLFIGFYGSGFETGIYQVSSQISLTFAVVLSGISTVLAPLYSSLQYQKDQVGLRQVYSIGNKWGLYLGLPILAVLFSSPQKILTVMFGAEYSSGWTPLIILLLGQSINLATGASAPLLVMSGGQRIWFKLTVITFGVDVILNSFLTPALGMNGTALATSICVSFLSISVLLTIRRNFKIWPYDRRYLKGLVAVSASFLVCWLIERLLFSDLITLVLQFAGSVAVFGLVLIILKLDPEDLVFINLIRDRVKKMAGLTSEI